MAETIYIPRQDSGGSTPWQFGGETVREVTGGLPRLVENFEQRAAIRLGIRTSRNAEGTDARPRHAAERRGAGLRLERCSPRRAHLRAARSVHLTHVTSSMWLSDAGSESRQPPAEHVERL